MIPYCEENAFANKVVTTPFREKVVQNRQQAVLNHKI